MCVLVDPCWVKQRVLKHHALYKPIWWSNTQIAEYTTERKKAQLEYDTLDAKFKAEQSHAKDYQQALEVSSRELESAVQRNKVKVGSCH